jgi:NO-binding membrane sensor protein with MHYT domain
LFGILIAISRVSGANFWNNDALVPRGVQSVLNLLLAFLSGVAILDIFGMRALSNEGRVLRAATLLLLSSLGLALPLVLTMLWFAHRLGFEAAINVGWLDAIAALVGVAISYLSYREKQREA